ncbi:MAG TPA: efflux RND transporter periplasmic adaptor subunit [Candidatus Acidoferrales bacterium]|nr:efflux RND transporter periplasmic adaptor subunit [Candidatus Acidoferrales bacterium]
MKRVIPLVLLLLAAGALLYFRPQWFQRRVEVSEMKLSGNIEAHESLLGFKVPGRIVDLPVEEGQSVKEGQLLSRLDTADYKQQVAVDDAMLRVRDRQLALALAGSRRQDIQAAHEAVVDARADLEQKQRDFERYDALLKKDEIPAQTRDQARTNVTRARATLARLEQNYSELEEGTRKEEIAVDHASAQQARQNLELSRIKLSYTTLTAPFSGVILVRQAELGEVVAPATPVVTLADLDHIWVRVYLPETELSRLRWGQDVAVKTDSYPGKTYHGRVSFISSEAEFTPKSVQTQQERVTLVYRVKVDVDNPKYELKPGMPADVYVPVK